MENIDFKPNYLEYTYHEGNDLHVFIFNESSRRALDEWHHSLQAIFPQYQQGKICKMLLDITDSGMQPMGYAMQKARKLQRELGTLPHTRYAFLHQPNALTTMINTFFEILRTRGELRFFRADERDQALEWLQRE